MITLLHFRHLDEPPLGIWWSDSDSVEAYYPEGNDLAANAGYVVMSNKVPSATWEEYFKHLTELLPYFDAWAFAYLDDEVDPIDYYEYMVSTAKKELDADN